ncbi:hypothetical protein QC762_0065960 [Podospora pseudocomata]|uniref:Uncharacterized protein n=1 Tax=Podospora pseudocomata TaxID=2093779 RepID=A0ABR0GFV0_9PEZI|nr:hypothetical protein QC762_0065960 [Podospora pseudocomata]
MAKSAQAEGGVKTPKVYWTLYKYQRVKHGVGHVGKTRPKPAVNKEGDDAEAGEKKGAVQGLVKEVVDEVEIAQREMLEELKSWDEHARLSNLWGKMVVTAGVE